MKRVLTAALLCGALLIGGQPAAEAGNREFGRTWAKDKVLPTAQTDCNTYRYQYRIKPPTGDWAFETFIVRVKNKKSIASGAFISGEDPKRGTGKFRICPYVAKPGKYKIRGKLTWWDGYDESVRWVKAGRFRFRKAD